MKCIEIGDCIHNPASGKLTSGIIIEASREEIAAITDNILYNEVTVSRVKKTVMRLQANGGTLTGGQA